jgi:hypothetical protein
VVPPSRQSWVWQISAAAAERAQQIGSAFEDIRIDVTDLDGALRVRIGDTNLRSWNNPALLASATLPDAHDAAALREEVRAALEVELQRLRTIEPPPNWRAQMVGELATWIGRAGVDLQSLDLHLDEHDGAVRIHAHDADGEAFSLPLPAGVHSIDLPALVTAAREESRLHASSVRH